MTLDLASRVQAGPRTVMIETGDTDGETTCFVELMHAYGGNVYSDPLLQDAGNRSALKQIGRAFPRETFARPNGGRSETAIMDMDMDMVGRGSTAFARLWPADSHQILNQQAVVESTGAELRQIPIPGGSLGGQVVAVAARSANREAAEELANQLSQALSQTQLFGGGYVPTLQQLYADDKVQKELTDLRAHLPGTVLRPPRPRYTEWSTWFRSAIRAGLPA